MDDKVSIDFRFRYSRVFYPTKGTGAISGLPVKLASSGNVEIPKVSEYDAPLVARLAIPGSRATVDVRSYMDGFVRTVCDAGSKVPCTVERFRRNAVGTSAWRDSPFDGPREENLLVNPIEFKSMGDYRAKRWSDFSDEDDVRGVIARNMEGHVVVGDQVYVRCQEPKLRTFTRQVERTVPVPRDLGGAYETEARIGWWFPDFDQYSDPDSGRVKDGANVPRCYGFAQCLDRFRLDRETDATEYVEAYATLKGLRVADRSDVLVSLEPELLTSPDDAFVLMALARKHMNESYNVKQEWSEMGSLSRDKVESWFEAKSILALRDHELGVDDVVRALDLFAYASEDGRDDRVGTTSRALGVRWAACERGRDFSLLERSLDRDSVRDEDALLGMAP